jgi:hypothetical protein
LPAQRSTASSSTVVTPRPYDREHPSTALLVIEVADSSLEQDRGLKATICAGAAIPELWVVNLVDRRVEVHLEPVASRYRRVVTLRPGEALRPQSWPDVEVAVDDGHHAESAGKNGRSLVTG